ncbi:MAG: 2Fe-2S iron-sulfur cluster-binding protein [Rhizobiaceae bacterium]|nr:2Fe-2S iron-sulfur cluster-binding protein [Rhizobiaceae bacterium]
MPVIALQGTDTKWTCADDDTLMRSALRAGLGFPYECNVGSCGNCRFELVEGEIEHLRADPPGLTERDRDRGRRLGCQARPLNDCTIKVRLMPRYKSKIPPARHAVELVGTCDITHDIRQFRFRPLDGSSTFLPGQYALLEIPGVQGSRAYSMSNTGCDGEWQFLIRRVPGGQATNRLFEAIELKDRIVLDGPYGMAYLQEDSHRDIICLAGGSGLSPMISIARAAAQALGGRRLDFFFGGRTARDICGSDMLEELPGFGSSIHYHPAVSTSEAEGWNGYRGFVHVVAANLVGQRLPDCEIYFAGPPAMAEAVQKMLVERKVPAEQMHFDQFF